MTGDLTLFFSDLLGLLIASSLGLLLLLAPGAPVAKALDRVAPHVNWAAFTPALAFAVLPIFDAVALRRGGMPAIMLLRVSMAAAAFLWARDFIPRPSRIALAAFGVWWLFIAGLYCDIDIGGRLYQSLTVIDLVKHSAVIRELALHGLPLHDPFFARPETAGYYHYFYDAAAVLDWVSGGLVDPRMAFAGAAFCCGIAMAGLLRALVVTLGWQTTDDRRLTLLTALVCAMGGLDLGGIAFRWLTTGIVEPNAEWWDDEISLFATSASWVPHHLAAVIAGFLALLLLAQAVTATSRRNAAVLVAIAALCMASAFGLSVWITLGLVCILPFCLSCIPTHKLLTWTVAVAVAGVVALCISADQLLDVLHGRADSGSPIWLAIREPAKLSDVIGRPISPLIAIPLTPLVWAMEFGALALGSWLFWRHSGLERDGLFARMLVVCALGAGMMNLLLRSVILYNDFGWRVAWFAALPAMLWTIAVLQKPLPSRRWSLAMNSAICLGLGATGYNLIAARIVRPPLSNTSFFSYVNDDPIRDYGLAEAYRWAARNLPPTAVLQHDPSAAPRAFAFGLYGVQPTGVADKEASLFGASRMDVEQRTALYRRIFAGELALEEAGNVHLVVASSDKLWSSLPLDDCLFRSETVCITKAMHR